MTQTMVTSVSGNVEAMELIDKLGHMGVSREHIRMQEPAAGPEHGTDVYGSWSFTSGVLAGLFGAACGWVIMSWSPMPWVGALWGAAIGSVTGARYGGYAVVGLRAAATVPTLPMTRVEIDVVDDQLITVVQTLCLERERTLQAQRTRG